MESHLTCFLTLCRLFWVSEMEGKGTFILPTVLGLKCQSYLSPFVTFSCHFSLTFFPILTAMVTAYVVLLYLYGWNRRFWGTNM